MKLARPIIYVCRDIERALGLDLSEETQEGYFIISNKTTFSAKLQAELPEAARKRVLLINPVRHSEESAFGKTLLDTHELLVHPHAVRFIDHVRSHAQENTAGAKNDADDK